jgi:hypothetical protein
LGINILPGLAGKILASGELREGIGDKELLPRGLKKLQLFLTIYGAAESPALSNLRPRQTRKRRSLSKATPFKDRRNWELVSKAGWQFLCVRGISIFTLIPV